MKIISELPQKGYKTTELGDKRRAAVMEFVESGAEMAILDRLEPEKPLQKEVQCFKQSCDRCFRVNQGIKLEFHARKGNIVVIRKT